MKKFTFPWAFVSFLLLFLFSGVIGGCLFTTWRLMAGLPGFTACENCLHLSAECQWKNITDVLRLQWALQLLIITVIESCMYRSFVKKDTSIKKWTCLIAFCKNYFFSKCALLIHLPSSLFEVSRVVRLVLLQQWKQGEVNYLWEEVNKMAQRIFKHQFLVLGSVSGHLATNEVATKKSTRHQPSRHQEAESPPAIKTINTYTY